jgi:anti-sigma regulatory factor (Ser/Thr protein kinase)
MESISESVDCIRDFCESNKLDPKQTIAIPFSMEEMLVLIREHCFEENSSDTINVRVLIFKDNVILRIRNDGKTFNPMAYYVKQKFESEGETDITDRLSDTLGIGMVLMMARAIDYRSTFGVNNLTILL